MTTYYVSQVDGNDSYNGQYATWEGGLNGPWLTIAKADDLSGDQSDNSVLFNRGGTWREQWTLACNGTSGHPFIIGAYGTGSDPKIYGSTKISTWTYEATNLWYATLAVNPTSVWFINTDGSIKWGNEETIKGDLSAEYDCWWDDPNDRLYVYVPGGDVPGSDPDTRYTSIEVTSAGVRDYCIYFSAKSYLTVQDLELAFAENIGLRNTTTTQCYGYTVSGCHIHHCGVANGSVDDCIKFSNIIGLSVSDCELHDGGGHALYVLAMYSLETSSVVIERNTVYNSYHTGIDTMCMTSTSTLEDIIIRYNLIYSDTNYAYPSLAMMHIYTSGDVADSYCDDVVIHHNILLNMAGPGLKIGRRTRNSEAYNNTIYGSNALYTGDKTGMNIDSTCSGIILKNNIAIDNGTRCLYVGAIGVVSGCDYNCWYQTAEGSANIVEIVGTGTYHYDDFAAYKTATGWDTNGFWEDPKFVNAGGTTAEDYKLASNSPLINEGVDVSLTEDYWGTSIPQGAAPDIGAHEYVMGVASNYLENEILDHVFKVGSYSVPTNLYVALCKSTIEDSDTGSTLPSEISVGSYARKRCNTWTTASGGALSNNMAIAFVEATANWGTITDFAVTDSGSGGNMLVYGKLLYPKRVLLGDVFRFATNDLDIGLD